MYIVPAGEEQSEKIPDVRKPVVVARAAGYISLSWSFVLLFGSLLELVRPGRYPLSVFYLVFAVGNIVVYVGSISAAKRAEGGDLWGAEHKCLVYGALAVAFNIASAVALLYAYEMIREARILWESIYPPPRPPSCEDCSCYFKWARYCLRLDIYVDDPSSPPCMPKRPRVERPVLVKQARRAWLRKAAALLAVIFIMESLFLPWVVLWSERGVYAVYTPYAFMAEVNEAALGSFQAPLNVVLKMPFWSQRVIIELGLHLLLLWLAILVSFASVAADARILYAATASYLALSYAAVLMCGADLAAALSSEGLRIVWEAGVAWLPVALAIVCLAAAALAREPEG